MPGYFGNGYFVKILQRGAAPVGRSRSRPTQMPVEVKETVTTGGGQLSEVSGQTFAAQNESLVHPVTTSPQPSLDDPLVEPRSVVAALPASTEVAMTTSLDSHETAVPTVTTNSMAETPDRESQPISFSSEQSPEPSVDHGSHESAAPAKTPRVSRSANRVFELRMPEDFYVPARHETSSVGPTQTRTVSADNVSTQTESGSAVKQFIDVGPATIRAEAKSPLESAIVPQRAGESHELQIVELSQPGSTAESQVTPQASQMANEIVSQVMQHDVQPSRLIPSEAFESPAPTPRAEQVPEYLALQQPSIAPAAVVPPARLQINRLDIQVINQAAAPPPPQPAHAPDVSQLLEKKHLGRVELLL